LNTLTADAVRVFVFVFFGWRRQKNLS